MMYAVVVLAALLHFSISAGLPQPNPNTAMPAPSSRPWVPPDAAATAIQAAVDKAVAEKQNKVHLPSGDAYFNDAGLNLTDAHGLHLYGTTSTVLFFRPGVGVKVSNSSNCGVHSIQIDYSPLPYVYSTILAIEASVCTTFL